MKRMNQISTGIFFLATFLFLCNAVQAQDIQYFRYWDQRGVNVFEAPRNTDVQYDGLKVRIGGNFTQQYQSLSHENGALNNAPGEENALYPLGSGFNLATANLNLDVQLGDGIRLSLENYMSSRHHSEFWVKGGYIQVDKLPMFDNTEWFTKYLRVRLGHFQPNYGDQQFRRSDNGNTMYNPFVGNYIMDAFTTEIGGELYVFPTDDFTAMLGLTNGLINGSVADVDGGKGMSLYLKLAYDKQINNDLRLRISGSLVNNGGSARNTLYSGDRTGSRYYLVMEPEGARAGSNFTSGRINPGFTYEVTAIQFNPFVKYKGLEFFGTYEMSSGKSNEAADKRDVDQISAELLYRFLPREQLYIGARYNQVSGDFGAGADDVTIDRTSFAIGWFATKNLLLKAEYATQNYDGFPEANILHEGNFNGIVIEAAVGF